MRLPFSELLTPTGNGVVNAMQGQNALLQSLYQNQVARAQAKNAPMNQLGLAQQNYGKGQFELSKGKNAPGIIASDEFAKVAPSVVAAGSSPFFMAANQNGPAQVMSTALNNLSSGKYSNSISNPPVNNVNTGISPSTLSEIYNHKMAELAGLADQSVPHKNANALNILDTLKWVGDKITGQNYTPVTSSPYQQNAQAAASGQLLDPSSVSNPGAAPIQQTPQKSNSQVMAMKNFIAQHNIKKFGYIGDGIFRGQINGKGVKFKIPGVQ